MLLKNKLLLINNEIPDLGIFVSGLNDSVYYVIYSYTDSVSSLLSKILDLGINVGNNLDYLGFVFHFNSRYLFLNDTHFFDIVGKNIINSKFTNFVSSIISLYGIETLDFLACNLAKDSYWREYIDMFSSQYNVIVRASTNETGNLHNGGDWILETSGDNITSLYFNEKISSWNGLLIMEAPNYSSLNCVLTLETEYNAYFSGTPLNNFPNNKISNLTKLDESHFNKPPTNKKILQVSIGDNITIIITNENTNNLYISTGDLFTNDYFIDKRVISSVVSNNNVLIITDEKKNNLYTLNSEKELIFTNDIEIFRNKKIIYISNHFDYSIVLTDEKIDNLYFNGLNSISGRLGFGLSNTQNYLWSRHELGLSIKKVVCSYNTTILLTNDNKIFIAGTINNNTNDYYFNDYTTYLPNSETPINIFGNSVSNTDYHTLKYDLLLVLTNKNRLYYLNYLNYLGLNIINTDRPPNENVFNLLETPENIDSVYTFPQYIIIANNVSTYFIGDFNDNTSYEKFSEIKLNDKLVAYEYSFNTNVITHNGNKLKSKLNDLDNNIIYFANSVDYNNNYIQPYESSKGNYKHRKILNTNIDIEIDLKPSDIIATKHICLDLDINRFECVYLTSRDLIHKYLDTDTNKDEYYDYTRGKLCVFTKHFSEVSIANGNELCLCSDTTVLTIDGYKNITTIKLGDLLISNDQNIYPVTNISKTTHTLNDNTYPYIVLKNSITNHYPPEDVRLSRNHLILTPNNNWIAPNTLSKIVRDKTMDTTTYYHISLGDYSTRNLIVNGGCIVETMCLTDSDYATHKNRKSGLK